MLKTDSGGGETLMSPPPESVRCCLGKRLGIPAGSPVYLLLDERHAHVREEPLLPLLGDYALVLHLLKLAAPSCV